MVLNAGESAYLADLDGLGIYAKSTKPGCFLTSLEGRARRSEAKGGRNGNERESETHVVNCEVEGVCDVVQNTRASECCWWYVKRICIIYCSR